MLHAYHDYMCFYHNIIDIVENAEKIRRCGAQAHLKAIFQKYPKFKRGQDPQPKQIQIEINLADKSRHSTE